MPPGVFLSLDGPDGTGKSTQCRLLAAWLRARGWNVTECADPGGTVLGDRLRELLLHSRHQMTPACEMFLFMASRAQLVTEIIRPALAGGRAVVCDRFLLANVVYQGHAGGLPPEQLWQVGRLATGDLLPDLTLVLDLPPEQAFERGRPADRMESRGADYRARVRAGFLEEARRQPDRIRVLEASQSIESVHQQIGQEIARVLGTSPRA